VPSGPEEAERLRLLRERLGFDPVRNAHELTAREHGAKRDAKRALKVLITENIAAREAACFSGLTVDGLVARGERNGLGEFVQEVEERVVMLAGRARGGSTPLTPPS